jgi:integrase
MPTVQFFPAQSPLALAGEMADAHAAAIAAVGEVANRAAASALFADYRSRRAPNTLRLQDNALANFSRYLVATGVPAAPGAADLAADPSAWQGVTWGLVAGFARWLLRAGYAVSAVNSALSVVRTYSRLAMQAGAIEPAAYVAIRAVAGYSRTEGKRVDELRAVARLGWKKAEPVTISPEQAKELKRQPATPQGRRDALLVCLLLDHGLRVGEVARLQVSDLDLGAGELRFYRPKVDKAQTHRLTRDALAAARAYVDSGDCPALGPLLRASRRGGELGASGMTERAISERMRVLGRAVGVEGLSAHDLRHAWATRAARNGTPIDRLQDAGGWSSPAMPLRYVEAAKIANEGVRV